MGCGRERSIRKGDGAVDRTVVCRREAPITSAAMVRFYGDLQASHRHAKRITVVVVNARRNRSRELRADPEKPTI